MAVVTSRGFTYGKQGGAAIIICVLWALDNFYQIRPWYHLIRYVLGPWVDTWSTGVKITVETVLVMVFIAMVVWVIRPSDLKVDYYQG